MFSITIDGIKFRRLDQVICSMVGLAVGNMGSGERKNCASQLYRTNLAAVNHGI